MAITLLFNKLRRLISNFHYRNHDYATKLKGKLLSLDEVLNESLKYSFLFDIFDARSLLDTPLNVVVVLSVEIPSYLNPFILRELMNA